ncbi:unnamed protein product [Penicillium salamii]|uniref:NAD(P)-binding domain-containing protein n=1 Tax=Penicillium salamii TaxID=1612424 RepID=A0A9W4JV49_9EURO|nr:unnamed protein product [Penicillium salamii]
MEYCASLNNFRMINHCNNFHLVQGDICNVCDVESVLVRYKVTTVVHLAAQSHVDMSFEDPLSCTKTNVLGTQVLLEACRKQGSIRRFLHISTDEVYGQNDKSRMIPFSEENALHPTNPYAASKAAAEMIIRAYLISFQMPIIVVRCNNVFGPCQFPEMSAELIPKLIKHLINGDKIPIHGNGDNIRSFIFASDAAEALDVILHQGKVGEIYNVSSDTRLQVIEVAAKIRAYLIEFKGLVNRPDYIEMVKNRPFNDSIYWTSGSKLQNLGWRQRTNFEEGLQATIDWYCEHLDKFWVDTKI